jgi:membrane protease subunit HflK
MTGQEQQNNENLQVRPGDELGAAGKSLSEALGISFIILKIIMIVLVVVFLASGFRTVAPDEQALVLRFGKIRGIGEERLLGPGLHWVLPYPIDEIEKIPVAKKVNLAINSFWYFQRPDEMLPAGPKDRIRIDPTLDPIADGYCITRSEKQRQGGAGSAGSDYNIVHCKWRLIYQIDKPELFFRDVYVEDVKPGQVYFDIMKRSVEPLLRNLVEDAVVTTMVNYTIDEARSSDERIARGVKKLVQQKLDEIRSGIMVESMLLTEIIWPRQVDEAFEASIVASQASQRFISEAKLYAEKTLNQAGGPVAEELLAALGNEAVGAEERELLWSQLAGAARERITQARAYRTKVVEAAKANAEYLQEILPEYRKRPKLVLQKIYLDAVEYVLSHADEKFIIQPTEGTRGREIRVLLNRDPTIKPRTEQEE